MIFSNRGIPLQIMIFSEQTIIDLLAEMSQPSTKIILGNWALRGRGHVIRLLMEHLKIPYEERIYKTPQSWYDDPLSRSNPNIELPYLIDDGFLISSPIPIINYILRTFGHQNFLGESIEEQAQVDMHMWAIENLFRKLLCLGTKNDVTVEQLKVLKQEVWGMVISPKLKRIEDSISSDMWYLPHLSVIDFDIYELISYLRIIFPSKMDQVPKMQQIERRVSELENTRTYSNSQKCRSICFLPVEMCKRFKVKNGSK